jgi:hypothetical protein
MKANAISWYFGYLPSIFQTKYIFFVSLLPLPFRILLQSSNPLAGTFAHCSTFLNFMNEPIYYRQGRRCY